MKLQTAIIVQEGLAVIGIGLFAFGVWQIHPPACYILTGLILTLPFVFNIWRP